MDEDAEEIHSVQRGTVKVMLAGTFCSSQAEDKTQTSKVAKETNGNYLRHVL